MSKARFEAVAESSVPTPPAGRVTVFADSADDHMKQKDDAGIVSDLVGAFSDFQVSDGGGLTVNYTGGTVRMVDQNGFNFITLASGNLAGLTDNALNYVQIAGSGVIFATTFAFFTNMYPVAEVTTLAGAVTNIVRRYTPAGNINDLYIRPDSQFPQMLFGQNNNTVIAYMDAEGGDFQWQSLGGAGAGRNMRLGSAGGNTNQWECPNGSAAAPAYAFIADLTSGLFFTGTETSLSSAGFEGLRVAASVPAGGDCSVWIQHNDGVATTLKRVQAGAANSGGAGFRQLIIVN